MLTWLTCLGQAASSAFRFAAPRIASCLDTGPQATSQTQFGSGNHKKRNEKKKTVRIGPVCERAKQHTQYKVQQLVPRIHIRVENRWIWRTVDSADCTPVASTPTSLPSSSTAAAAAAARRRHSPAMGYTKDQLLARLQVSTTTLYHLCSSAPSFSSYQPSRICFLAAVPWRSTRLAPSATPAPLPVAPSRCFRRACFCQDLGCCKSYPSVKRRGCIEIYSRGLIEGTRVSP